MSISKIINLDTSIFEKIESQTTSDDRITLLHVQNFIRDHGPYYYLEIGSFRGGTIQPHYIDPLCLSINSIDPRPEYTPDERGVSCYYDLVKSSDMIFNLTNAFPDVNNKVTCFDSDTSSVAKSDLKCEPNLLFIDGEHTDSAAYKDFLFCCKVKADDSLIILHDSHYIYNSIPLMKKFLVSHSIDFKSLKLGGSIYCFFFGDYIKSMSPVLENLSICESSYFAKSRKKLLRSKIRNKFPFIYIIYKFLFR